VLIKNKKTIFYFPYAKQTEIAYNIIDSNLKNFVTYYNGKSSFEERVLGQNEFKNKFVINVVFQL